MSNAITSVIIASTSATAKVFVIGGIGYWAAASKSPILPPHALTPISKMNFNLLILPLIYATLASSVTPEKIGSLWFVLVSAFGVISLSFGVATLLGKLPFFRVENKIDFDALRIAAAFPNIVALPILIFPTLCEFAVVHDSFYTEGDDVNEEATQVEKYRSCVDQSNSMIFVYFFAWNFLYWVLGYETLVRAGSKRQIHNEETLSTETSVVHNTDDSFEAVNHHQQQQLEQEENGGLEGGVTPKVIENECTTGEEVAIPNEDEKTSVLRLIATALFKTISSPGFVAMILGFITACIPPLRDALFEPGGALRFFGSAMESLGSASSSVGTIIVAASLVHQANDDNIRDGREDSIEHDVNATQTHQHHNECESSDTIQQTQSTRRRSSMSQFGGMVRRRSSLALQSIRKLRKPTLQMHAWFITSRLIVAPAIVSLIIIGMDCGGILSDIPSLAKMVVIVNAGLPGAQLCVITLKSKGLTDSASIVAKVYLPSYLLSAVTIAAWTSIGLLVSIPDEDGNSFCNR
eukprot:g1518.t1 g1518   contig10:2262714-2264279(+)